VQYVTNQREDFVPRIRTLTPGASPVHHFGSEVRRAREAAGLSQSDLGNLVPCDKATVSRVEAGLVTPDVAFARACDAAFPEMQGWFVRFWRDSQTWGAVFPPSLREFAAYEAEAVTLWAFEHSLVPGLLQVEDYARAVLERHPDTSLEQAAERAAARIARQAVLDRDPPPRFWVLLDEQVLHRQVAPPNVMALQMRHLAEMAARQAVAVQLIPRAPYAHAGLSGAFAVAETLETTVAYLNHAGDSMTTDSPAMVGSVCGKFDWLRTEAYRGSESLSLIQEAAERWEA
jgi:transcriptional regulator with XRE-family HTH domain